MSVGGACNETVCGSAVLHALEQIGEGLWGEGDELAHGGGCAPVRRLLGDDEQDEAGEESLGLLVPVRLAGVAGRIVHEGSAMVAASSARSGLRVETVERIVGCGGPSGDAERVEDMDRSEPTAGGVGDARVVALGVDAEHRALGGEEVGNDGADTLAGSGWGEGEEVGWSVIVQERAGFAVRLELASDDEPAGAGVAAAWISRELAKRAEPCTPALGGLAR